MPTWKRGDTYFGRTAHIRDGDTLVVTYNDPAANAALPHVIRLARLDAAELRPAVQPGAVAARAALARLVSNRTLTIVPTRNWPDPYGRLIAEVWTEGVNVTNEMIEAGYATTYKPRLRKLMRLRKNGGRPTSATPTHRLTRPPATSDGDPISKPSMLTRSPTTTDAQPRQANPRTNACPTPHDRPADPHTIKQYAGAVAPAVRVHRNPTCTNNGHAGAGAS
jgi:hypothetical protein